MVVAQMQVSRHYLVLRNITVQYLNYTTLVSGIFRSLLVIIIMLRRILCSFLPCLLFFCMQGMFFLIHWFICSKIVLVYDDRADQANLR